MSAAGAAARSIGDRRSARGTQGFTLLEILIAITIAAALVAAAVQAHIQIERAQASAAAGLDRQRMAEVLLGRIERELQGVLLVRRPTPSNPGASEAGDLGARADAEPTSLLDTEQSYVFVATDGASADLDADSLRFVTRTPARAGLALPAIGLAEVTYEAVDGDEDDLALLRRERPLTRTREPPGERGTGERVADGIAAFNLAFVDESVGRIERWDSTQIEQLDRLPTQVEITLQLFSEDRAGERIAGPDHVRLVDLRVRPLDLEAMRARVTEESDQDCTTVEQCVQIYSEDLPEPGDPRRERIMQALGETSGECFDPASALADDLAALGTDPAEVCE